MCYCCQWNPPSWSSRSRAEPRGGVSVVTHTKHIWKQATALHLERAIAVQGVCAMSNQFVELGGCEAVARWVRVRIFIGNRILSLFDVHCVASGRVLNPCIRLWVELAEHWHDVPFDEPLRQGDLRFPPQRGSCPAQ